MERAYSILTVKSVEDEKRIIRGVATTPTPDRVGDIVEPLGVKFKNPLRLLWQHNKDMPVGTVTFDRPTKDGITFEARLPQVKEAGTLRDRIDEAWQSVKYGLIGAVSIGFRPLNDAVENLKNGGYLFKETEVLELSLVTIPANADATITLIRSIDADLRGAQEDGAEQINVTPHFKTVWLDDTKPNPGASGKSKNPNARIGTMSTNVGERIPALEAKRAAIVARLEGIQAKADAEGRTKDEKEVEEFDSAHAEVEAVDKELVDAKRLEKLKAATARPVNGGTEESGSASRAKTAIHVSSPDLPPGTRFARVAMSIAAGKGSLSDALEYAKKWEVQMPGIQAEVRKAVAGNTGDGSGVASSGDDWGAELVRPNDSLTEFLQLLMPRTILGRLSGLRNVPFNTRILGHDSGGTVNWVGEGAVKPVGEEDFSATTLAYHKIAGIVVITEELVRLSRPSAENLVREDLVRQVQKFMDEQFLDPNVFSTDNRPAAITNGVSGTAASGTDADSLYFDLNAMLATFDDSAEASDANITLLMRWSTARGIAMLRNALGQFEFSSLGQAGGSLFGYPVITSKSVPSGNIIAVNGGDIAIADDGRTRLDASNQATIDMNGGASPTTSLWQRNLLGLRVERFITWKKLRSSAVARITGAAYGPQASS